MPQLDTNFNFETPDIVGSQIKGMQVANYLKDRQANLKRLQFKDESDALDYLIKSAPFVTYDNYNDSKAHFESLGLHPDLLPPKEYFAKENPNNPQKAFEDWKEKSLKSAKQRLAEVQAQQKTNLQAQKDTAAMQRTRATQEGAMKRTEFSQKAAMDRAKLHEEGATKRSQISADRGNVSQNRKNYISSMNQILKEYGGSGLVVDFKNLKAQEGKSQAYQEMVRVANDTTPENAKARRKAKKNLKTYENLKKKLLAISGETQAEELDTNAGSWKNIPGVTDIPEVKHLGK